ncbi:MAG: nucleoside phosphorylase [Bacteroidales bacterium]|nr:nucleoside phosphorylase [Bacteroidales bacterium]
MIKESELIINSDGSIFHLHLKPENLAGNILLVGDQNRVGEIAKFFSPIEFSTQNREFKSVTGIYNKKRFTVISTGIGTDNIDIVLNELDALVNIDFKTREVKEKKESLNILRIGTSGSLQKDLPVNSRLVSIKSIGFDGLLNFYAEREKYCDLEFEKAFKKFTGWIDSLPDPYVSNAAESLTAKFSDTEFIKGVTISAPGFYGPQGRIIRLSTSMPWLNSALEKFRYNNMKITNFEMESSAIHGLSSMLGHQAATVCLIIANRVTGDANNNYYGEMKKLIKKVLDTLTN